MSGSPYAAIEKVAPSGGVFTDDELLTELELLGV